MTSTTFPHPVLPARPPLAARLVFGLLQRLQHGTLHVDCPDGTRRSFGTGSPEATLVLHDWSVCEAALSRGDIGFGEAYVDGAWTTPALAELLGLLVRNRDALESAVYGNWLGRLAARARHLLRRNSRRGSRRNIAAHYDLGNAFYRLWLDPTMNYSSALFEHPAMSLEQAQLAKMERALDAARAQPGARVLEIGCGWGALAERACARGAAVTAVTLSREQLAFARQRLAAACASGQASLRLQDYRDIADGPFDAIVSIEMVEAVGRAYWPDYFAAVARLLKPGGHACIQTIVIRDDLWERYAAGTDFIQQHVFPGGFLPCPREFERAAQAAGLVVDDARFFGPDYARTLSLWRDAFHAGRDALPGLGFDARFLRLWEFYLCYCEAAFAHGNTDVVQYTLRKP